MKWKLAAWLRKEGAKKFLTTVATLYLLFVIVFWLVRGERIEGLPVQWIWLGLVIGYTFASLKQVGPNKRGLILRFGNPIFEVRPGLKLVPLVVCTMPTITRTRIQLELPGEPEQIWRFTDEKDNELPLGIGKGGQSIPPPKRQLPDGTEKVLPWVSPYRITTAGPESCLLKTEFSPFKGKEKDESGADTPELIKWNKAEEAFNKTETKFQADLKTYTKKGDPLHQRLTVESLFIVRFRVANYQEFIQVIHDLDEAKRQIEDTVTGRVQFEFARRTPALILAHLDTINRRLLEDVEILVGEKEDPHTGEKRDPWGVKVEDVYVKLLGTTKTVNEEMAKRVAAEFIRHKLAVEGQGRGDAFKNELTGKAKGLAKVAATVGTPGGAYALAAQTAIEAIKPTDKVIVVGENPVASILGMVVGGKKALESPPSSSSPINS